MRASSGWSFVCTPPRDLMSLIHLIHVYGYIAILVGCFLEGETVLVLGGVAAAQGYLVLPGVMAAAFIGSLSGDQLFFHLGRRYGPGVMARKPRLRRANARLQGWMGRYETWLVLGFRFLYGLRSAAPFVGLWQAAADSGEANRTDRCHHKRSSGTARSGGGDRGGASMHDHTRRP